MECGEKREAEIASGRPDTALGKGPQPTWPGPWVGIWKDRKESNYRGPEVPDWASGPDSGATGEISMTSDHHDA